MLFEGGEETVERPAESAVGDARLKRANRSQSVLDAVSLDDLIAADHRARAFWHLLEGLDLSRFAAPIKSREGHVGRPAFDPQVLLCLWLFAISEGIGSARHLARLCERDAPYRWICGGLRPSAHTLSDFRVAHGAGLDELLTELLAALLRSGVVRLKRVAQDGVRVRASASAASFRRERSLRKCQKQAREQVRATKVELDTPARDESTRKQAARLRAAQDREQRVSKALEALEELRGGSQRQKDAAEVRASTSDPEARVMRMADGGYRPAFNVQAAVETESRLVVDVSVGNRGNDLNQLAPMLDRIQARTGRLPEQYLIDGGYAKKTEIERAEGLGVAIYAPPSKLRKGDPAKPRWDDGPGVVQWRERMADPASAKIYKERGASVETVFGDFRQWRGLRQLPVRGIEKATCIALLMALSYNLMRVIELGVGI
ncbi:MAG TPA: IS1182 family transposase [Planctomycetota bacterium]|nr:IS1182 family transposase [Planctomycetota bacterium]